MAKKPPKNLTAEDRYFWKKVTDTVKPKSPSSTDTAPLSDKDLFVGAMKTNAIKDRAIFKGAKQQRKKTLSSSSCLPQQPKVTNQTSLAIPPILHMDRKTKSRFARGIQTIDGRIDLHGMTQQQAYGALLTFIGRARASGWKTVLVITGKGAYSLDDNQPAYFEMGREAPGVLRRKVPQWLSEPEMRQFIIGYDKAAPNHGGGGALYVRVRRQKT